MIIGHCRESFASGFEQISMIPKIIHYIWLGGNPLPPLAEKCIESWKKFFPDYEIKEWNESNYDVRKIRYISQAYDAKKYAFVSDYVRFDVLYQNGGIYFDTDVEVIKPFDSILQNGSFMGFESAGNVATGLGMGCNAGLGIIHHILQSYKNMYFINHDGSYNLCTVVEYVTDILKKNGLEEEDRIQIVSGLTIYPTDYFCPMLYEKGIVNITKNTYSIHHFAASWHSEEQQQRLKFSRKVYNTFGTKSLFSKFVIMLFYVIKRIKKTGLVATIKYYLT